MNKKCKLIFKIIALKLANFWEETYSRFDANSEQNESNYRWELIEEKKMLKILPFNIFQPAVVFDVIVYPLHSIELLVSSVDRLLVVIFPVKYFIHPKRFFISQLLIAHIFFIIISLSTVIVALLFYRTKIISNYCR